jgi:hypothetical protein
MVDAGASPVVEAGVTDAGDASRTGACMTDETDGGLFTCVEYPAGNESVLAAVEQGCPLGPSGYVSTWAAACPTGQVNGCLYPPGAFGAPAGETVWYYERAGGCTSDGTTIGPPGADE